MKTIKKNVVLSSATVLALALMFAPEKIPTSGIFMTLSSASPVEDPSQDVETFCFEIPKATLEKVFAKAGDSDVVTEIYPIMGPSGAVKDLGVRFVFRDSIGKKLGEHSSLKKSKFKKSAKRYANFLKNRKVKKDEAMIGFQIQLTKESLDSSEQDNELCVSLATPEPQFKMMMAKSVYDSCKIPPGCRGLQLAETTSINAVLDDTYGENP